MHGQETGRNVFEMNLRHSDSVESFTGTVMEIEKALINDSLFVSKVF